MDTRLLTYGELGEALGITVESAKRLARRRGWMKQPGNDGRARVAVPVERLVPRDDRADDPGAVRGDGPTDDRADDPRGVLGVVAALERHVERLERDLDGAKQELQAAKVEASDARAQVAVLQIEAAALPALRVTVEALKGALETEKGRVWELRAERDRLAARRAWWPFRRVGS